MISGGGIRVANHFKSAIANIYAIGDVIQGPMLAHRAEEDGVVVAEQIASGTGDREVNYNTVPNVVYTWPEVASVGESEEQLKTRGVAYQVGRFPFTANGAGAGHEC